MTREGVTVPSFSALQRAENSSINLKLEDKNVFERVSVLFSEPKIPQSSVDRHALLPVRPFQCSSASRKFLNVAPRQTAYPQA